VTTPEATSEPSPDTTSEPPPDTTSGPTTETCPSCGEVVHIGDAFCESCGATLDPAAAIDSPQPGPIPALVDGETTQPTPEEPAPAQPPGGCASCGGEEFADGFCTTCGAKRPSWRDHFTESPVDWAVGVCDKGVGRNRNEDGMALAVVGDRAVLVVCDGVTTAPDSDRASLAAARAARDVLAAAPAGPDGTAAAISHWGDLLLTAGATANREAVAVAHALGDPSEPPSCTFVAAVQEGGLLHVAWCGDSRAYWLPDAAPGQQLTRDHSLGTELIAAGVARADAEADPMSHTITRWLGADSINPTPETAAIELGGPGWVLVCSDGLWNHLSDAAELAAFVEATGSTDARTIADALVDRANAGGGHDNITAVLARLGRDGT
jgi:serine/threonine protein phosphatase PrpC